jgi:hypothetical protein
MGSAGLAALLILSGTWEAKAALPFFKRSPGPLTPPVFAIPLEELSGRQQEIRQLLQAPTVTARGPTEKFVCRPDQYHYFLDHPDQAVTVWRRLGAKCVSISDRGGGHFGWADELGSDVSWETVFRGPETRVWFAHGKVRAAPMLPMVPVDVLVVLHHSKSRSEAGNTVIEHHADLFLHTDSKTVALFARLMGTSTSRMAEQGLTQLQMFFSALSWYLDQHPQRAEALLADLPEIGSTVP